MSYKFNQRSKFTSKTKSKRRTIVCPYCGNVAVLRDGSYLFENVAVKKLYVCSHYPKCDAYVSAYDDSLEPMGPLADGKLRKKRMEAHSWFDRLWLEGIFTRKQAYGWIEDVLFLTRDEAHIGEFYEGRCDSLISECKKVLANHGLTGHSRRGGAHHERRTETACYC